MLLVGIDWADKEHVYCLMDETGTTLSTGKVAHTAEGLEHFMTAVRARAQGSNDVLVAIETSHARLVSALLEHGFTVYAMNPKAVERNRERLRMSDVNRKIGAPRWLTKSIVASCRMTAFLSPGCAAIS